MAARSRALTTRAYKNLYGFADSLSKKIKESLMAVNNSGVLSRYPDEDENTRGAETRHRFLRIFIDGYFRDEASSMRIIFSHQNQRLLEPQVKKDKLGTHTHGSGVIAKLLASPESNHFTMLYKKPHPVRNLEDAAERAANSIRAYSDPEALRLDEWVCSGIGGHIHVAAITPDRGFQWMPGFEPA